MKYSAFFILIISSILFSNCSKKDLPAPDPLNSTNTKFNNQAPSTQNLTAPCEESLTNNNISYSIYSDGGYDMAFSPTVYDGSNGIEISCVAYGSYNTIKITIPSKGKFIGKVRYDVRNTYVSSTVALLSHKIGSYSYLYYYGYEGEIYAEYTKTQIILSFCAVKVKDSSNNSHTITGKTTVPNNN